MPTVKLPSALVRFSNYCESVDVDGVTIYVVLTNLIAQHPNLKPYIFNNDNELCTYVSIYLNNKDIRNLNEKETPVDSADIITIIPAIAGG